jgi:hypothetical protein
MSELWHHGARRTLEEHLPAMSLAPELTKELPGLPQTPLDSCDAGGDTLLSAPRLQAHIWPQNRLPLNQY